MRGGGYSEGDKQTQTVNIRSTWAYIFVDRNIRPELGLDLLTTGR